MPMGNQWSSLIKVGYTYHVLHNQWDPISCPDGIAACVRRITADLVALITVNLNHFRLLRVVGKGAFGKVRIVERKDTGLTFALKYIRKDEGEHPDTTCTSR